MTSILCLWWSETQHPSHGSVKGNTLCSSKAIKVPDQRIFNVNYTANYSAVNPHRKRLSNSCWWLKAKNSQASSKTKHVINNAMISWFSCYSPHVLCLETITSVILSSWHLCPECNSWKMLLETNASLFHFSFRKVVFSIHHDHDEIAE